MIGISVLLQIARTQFLSTLAKKAMSKTVKSRFGRKVVKGAARSKGKRIVPTKKKISSAYKGDLKSKAKMFQEAFDNAEYMSTLSDIDLKELINGMEYVKKQIEQSIKYGKYIQNMRKVKSIYKQTTQLESTITNKIENKIVDLLFGKKGFNQFSGVLNDKEIKAFEKRLNKFQKNPGDVKKFNKMMSAGDNDINAFIGLDSSWLWWGIWSPTKSMKKFGNVILKIKPWVSSSSKNPSLIYNYGVYQKRPPMHYSVWKTMTNSPHAGTTYWHKYLGIAGKFKTKKAYYSSYAKKRKK